MGNNKRLFVAAQLVTLDKAEGSNLKGIIYLRTVGEADDFVKEIEVRMHHAYRI